MMINKRDIRDSYDKQTGTIESDDKQIGNDNNRDVYGTKEQADL